MSSRRWDTKALSLQVGPLLHAELVQSAMLLRCIGELQLPIEIDETHLAVLETSRGYDLGLLVVRSLFQHGDEGHRDLKTSLFERDFSVLQAHLVALE